MCRIKRIWNNVKGVLNSCVCVFFSCTHHPITFRAVTLANTKLVRASPTAMRAPAAGHTRPLTGCSPMEVAAPSKLKGERATTATSARGVWRGPTHCCWATNPVTERSTWKGRRMVESAHVYCACKDVEQRCSTHLVCQVAFGCDRG